MNVKPGTTQFWIIVPGLLVELVVSYQWIAGAITFEEWSHVTERIVLGMMTVLGIGGGMAKIGSGLKR